MGRVWGMSLFKTPYFECRNPLPLPTWLIGRICERSLARETNWNALVTFQHKTLRPRPGLQTAKWHFTTNIQRPTRMGRHYKELWGSCPCRVDRVLGEHRKHAHCTGPASARPEFRVCSLRQKPQVHSRLLCIDRGLGWGTFVKCSTAWLKQEHMANSCNNLTICVQTYIISYVLIW